MVIKYPQSIADEMEYIDFDFSRILLCPDTRCCSRAIALRCGGNRGQFTFLQQRDNASNWNGETTAQIATDTSFMRSMKI